VLRITNVEFDSPTWFVEVTILNAQYVVALVEEGPDQADALFNDIVDLADRVGDIDPASLEPALDVLASDDPNDPGLDDLDPEVREDASDFIAYQAWMDAVDPDSGDGLGGIVETECAAVLPAPAPDSNE